MLLRKAHAHMTRHRCGVSIAQRSSHNAKRQTATFTNEILRLGRSELQTEKAETQAQRQQYVRRLNGYVYLPLKAKSVLDSMQEIGVFSSLPNSLANVGSIGLWLNHMTRNLVRRGVTWVIFNSAAAREQHSTIRVQLEKDLFLQVLPAYAEKIF